MIEAEAHCDSSGRVQNLSGLPNEGSWAAIFRQRCPAAAVVDDGVEFRGRVMIAPLGVLHQGAIGYEDQVVFGKINAAQLSVLNPFDAACDLVIGCNIECDIHHLRVELNLDALLTKPCDQRQHERLVLVVLSELQCAEVRQAVDVVNETLNVELHLQGAVPLLEGKHRSPVEPEVGVEEILAEDFVDSLFVELFGQSKDEINNFLSRL